jgi:hypothetical protein
LSIFDCPYVACYSGLSIKNGQSRVTGDIGAIKNGQRTNTRSQNTTQKTKLSKTKMRILSIFQYMYKIPTYAPPTRRLNTPPTQLFHTL